MAIVWFITIVCAIVAVAFLWLSNRRRTRLVDKLPGPPTHPILGNALDLYVDHSEIIGILRRLTKDYGPKVFRLWFGYRPWGIIATPLGSEIILSNPKYITKASEYDYLVPWLGTGLLTSSGDKWKSRRKLLTPAFHFRILEDFMNVYNEQADILVKCLKPVVCEKSVDLFPFITRCTLDVICDTAMGQNVNAQGNTDSDYVLALYSISDIIHSRQLRPWLWPNWLFKLTPSGREHARCLKVLHSFTNQVVKQRRSELENRSHMTSAEAEEEDMAIGKKRRLAFLDLLLNASENGRPLSDLDIREEVDTFMFEGHDTTAASISWTLYMLGLHPEMQEKVHRELDSIFGDSDRQCTSEDLKEMKYLECVIKETLRLFPSVPLVARELKEDVEIDGYTLPAGVTAIVLIYMIHRDPEVFPDPERFDPDRFLPENCVGRHPYAYVPFSAGPRNCIGQKFAMMEEKAVLSTFLRNYSVTSLEPREELKILAELILRPQNGVQVKLEARK